MNEKLAKEKAKKADQRNKGKNGNDLVYNIDFILKSLFQIKIIMKSTIVGLIIIMIFSKKGCFGKATNTNGGIRRYRRLKRRD